MDEKLVSPTVGEVLDWIDESIRRDLDQVRPFGRAQSRRIAELVEGMEVDLDQPLDPRD